ncbi:MAG: MotA/TolQ/ExbB proton channel family protein [Aeoliella sp.]
MSKIASFSEWLLRSPLVWGGMACMLMYAALNQGLINSTLLDRYLLGHPIEIATACLFFIAMAALAIRALGLTPQFLALDRKLLEPAPAGGQPVEDAPRLLDQLASVPQLYQQSYLVERLAGAIDYVRRKDSAESLEKHLHHLEEVDLDRMASGYSLTKVIVWAVPSLGFLGTVWGIAQAISHLSFDGDTIVQSLKQVIVPLSFAFDTTTLSLALLFPIMFAWFAVEKIETQLLQRVDQRTEQELIGRFFEFGSSNDPQVAAVRRMSEQVVRTVEAMSTNQGQVLHDTIEESHRHWTNIAMTTGKLLDESLQATLASSLEQHAESINTGIDRQIDMLNRGIQKNVNAIENGVVNRMSMVDDVFARQVSELEQLVTKQVDVLGLSIQAQSEQVQQGATELIGRLRDGLERMAELLVEALQQHGATLAESEEELAKENRRHLSEVEAALGESMVLAADRQEKLVSQSEKVLTEMQNALVSAADATVEQQEQLVKQGDILLKVVDATGQVKRLEESLNQNLQTLGKTHNFEETLLSLSAAIQLLSARTGRESAPVAAVEIQSHPNSSTQAA